MPGASKFVCHLQSNLSKDCDILKILTTWAIVVHFLYLKIVISYGPRMSDGGTALRHPMLSWALGFGHSLWHATVRQQPDATRVALETLVAPSFGPLVM